MNMRFLFKGIEVNEKMRKYIIKRIGRIEKFVDAVTLFEIEVSQDKKGKFRVEVMVKTPHQMYRAEEVTESIEGSTDTVIDELEAQIVKKKNKLHDLKLRGKRSIKKKLVVDAAARF
ncbi:MAG: ribosome-associated translation inhibitor RaiA [Candidatus Moranbacteria bacterium]|nr:ribosome-associated translation inhibitor RaiA [Candidatus Moranbacteria bacterium]MDD3965004.1 ribosome-associated translation inhibitor RaiA [Candidatus Moranbacteria bacterium]